MKRVMILGALMVSFIFVSAAGAARPFDAPPVKTPPVETPPVLAPPVERPPVLAPPVERPPVLAPPVETPPILTPPVPNDMELPPKATFPGFEMPLSNWPGVELPSQARVPFLKGTESGQIFSTGWPPVPNGMELPPKATFPGFEMPLSSWPGVELPSQARVPFLFLFSGE